MKENLHDSRVSKLQEILRLDESFAYSYRTLQPLVQVEIDESQTEEKEDIQNLYEKIAPSLYIHRRCCLLMGKANVLLSSTKPQCKEAFELRYSDASTESSSQTKQKYWEVRRALMQKKCEKRWRQLEDQAITKQVQISLTAAVLAQEAEDELYRDSTPPEPTLASTLGKNLTQAARNQDAPVFTPHFRQVFHMGCAVRVVRFAHGSERLLICGMEDGRMVLYEYNMETSVPSRQISVIQAHKGSITTAEWSFDNQFILTASEDQTMIQWQVDMTNDQEPVQIKSVAFFDLTPVCVLLCSVYSGIGLVAYGSVLASMSLMIPPEKIQEFDHKSDISTMILNESNTELYLALIDGQVLVYLLEEDLEIFRKCPIISTIQASINIGISIDYSSKKDETIRSVEMAPDPSLLASMKRWVSPRHLDVPEEQTTRTYAVQLVYWKFDYFLGHPILFVVDNNNHVWKFKVQSSPTEPFLCLLDSWLAPAESSGVTTFCLFPRSEAIVCGTIDRALKVFKIKATKQGEQERKPFIKIAGHHSTGLTQVVANDDESFMASTDDLGDIVLWSMQE